MSISTPSLRTSVSTPLRLLLSPPATRLISIAMTRRPRAPRTTSYARTVASGKSGSKPATGQEADTWFLYPHLHDQVSARLLEVDLSQIQFKSEGTEGHTKTWDTNIMGSFDCPGSMCRNGWSSKKIAISIRLYTAGNDTQYNALVYRQHCRSCDSLGTMRIDEAVYIERVVYWMKVWHGKEVEKPPVSNGRSKPHESELCEGCKAGHCPQMRHSHRGMLW